MYCCSLLFGDHRVSDTVPVAPGIPLSIQYSRWLEAIPTQVCNTHSNTVLKLDEPPHVLSSKYSNAEMPSKDGQTLEFDAPFSCPACRARHANVPPEFQELTFDGFETPTPALRMNLAQCRVFVAQIQKYDRGFLLMCGMCGIGKTRLACSILSDVNTRGNLYVTQARLTMLHRATYGRHDDTPPTKSISEKARNASILVLDELGASGMAPDEATQIDEILKARYDNGRPTILISNLPLAGSRENPGIKEFLGDALTDRIREASGNGNFILQFADGRICIVDEERQWGRIFGEWITRIHFTLSAIQMRLFCPTPMKSPCATPNWN